ncbi:hypothetical protein D3C77_757740 [compost metagenome]
MTSEGFPIMIGSTPVAARIDADILPAPGIKPSSEGSSKSGLVNTYRAPALIQRVARDKVSYVNERSIP